ncbi:hypothetical protein CkaCkLH20_07733 [Colletotrichum karsti]|uniref:Uncharacterized protein n=1 Tax=Colletotrichum karsti TaxID=1095194 RepID=A0A9P6I609_9PEZI|nr:uncharacterized protein CkaCkLH20_07733 [Colletotrichum karsti]KAF9874596.1 hypothetical protein CkaCkLH20_07733 [Colletotrichum karsti]
MALWPFRRRSGRKRSRSGANLSDVEAPPLRGLTTNDASHGHGMAATPKKQRLDEQHPHPSKKLTRRTRTYSFSPGRNDSIRVAGQKGSGPPVPGRLTGLFPADRNDGEEKGDPAWHRAPTLHNARNGQKKGSSSRINMKSSKRRREESDREAEIKAMTNFAPVRPAADDWTSGRPMRKQSKRVKTGLGFRRSFENPASDVSLPISIHSSMSSDSEMHSFRVSALEALAPRPTLRYTVSPRWGPGQSSSGQSRPHHQKRKVSERVPESVVRAHKRVNSFADDLDAADLRELMERDNRRRERKRQRDQERVERRLARRAEKQREAEAEARNSGSPPPPNMERGVLGREIVGLGIEATPAVMTSANLKRRASGSSYRPARSSREEAAPLPEPMDIDPDIHRTSSIQPDMPLSPPSPDTKPERKPSTKTTPKGSLRLRRSLLRSKKSRSKSPNAPDEEHAISQLSSRHDETPRKTSESTLRARLSFSALFRWGNRKRRNSGPSSFSNTSREEMQAAAAAQAQTQAQTQMQAPPPPPPPPAEEAQAPVQAIPPPMNYIPRKVSSGVPKRTRSRFREDLPELPLSPPDSRVGSPEVEEPPLPIVSEVRTTENILDDADSPAVVRHDTPTSDMRRVDEKMEKLEKMRQTPTSLRHSIQPSPEQPQSVSLASIDSEASWLSGRIGKRRSSGMRSSMQRFQPRNRSHSPSVNDTEEELADDEYLSNLATPSREMLAGDRTPRKSTGDAFPSSDEEELMDEADMKWGSVEKQRATPVVQHQRIKSREGLLNAFEDGSNTSPDNSEGETPQLQRATSVSLSRGHARHVSSSSTKMLEVSPRASVDQRRTSDAIY